jgi:hypothetical protein
MSGCAAIGAGRARNGIGIRGSGSSPERPQGSIEDPLSKVAARPETPSVIRTKFWRPGGVESLFEHRGPDDGGRADRLARPAKRIEQRPGRCSVRAIIADGPGARPSPRRCRPALGMFNAMTPPDYSIDSSRSSVCVIKSSAAFSLISWPWKDTFSRIVIIFRAISFRRLVRSTILSSSAV